VLRVLLHRSYRNDHRRIPVKIVDLLATEVPEFHDGDPPFYLLIVFGCQVYSTARVGRKDVESGEDFANDTPADIREALLSSLMKVGQRFMVQSHQV